MNEEEKLIKEQWDTLPPELQGAIGALPWKSLVQEIGKANALDAEQLTTLERETMFILYGFESPKDYVSNLVTNVGVAEDIAYNIAESVAEKIFEPISQKAGAGSNKSNLPVVEEGEGAHDVPHVETAPQPQPQPVPQQEPKVKTPLPDYRYPDGADPYREPLK